MFRKTFISVVATLTLGFGIVGMTSVAEAKKRGFDHGFKSPADHQIYKEFSMAIITMKTADTAGLPLKNGMKPRWSWSRSP